jgi:predicted DsbA family dithiol-disulfide isomerase
MGEALAIVAWIDFLDPWSSVLSARLDRLERDFGDQVTVQYRAFMTVTEPAERSLVDYRRTASEWKEAASQEPSLSFSMWEGDARPPTHSAPALAAARVVADLDPDRAADFRRAVFAAHFRDNRTISESPVLISLAKAVGVDEDVFAMALRGNYADYVQGVIDDHQEALAKGIEATPGLIVADEYVVKGHPSYLSLHTLVERLLADRAESDSEPDR